ncbi:endonuclease/exonuclease/phosphatase family protein [Micromonospora sp. NPDC049275]|uniref:endonuclease/exonuclease/phosphatase family protein n=1 Tax=Micromonospora sp. NPDC049275 TaxID=3364268 RepID=UPI003721124C
MATINGITRRAITAGLVGLLTVAGLAAPALAAAPPSSLAAIPNRFMTWNTNGQGLGTPESLVEQVRRFRPQVVALQESCLDEVSEAVRQLRQIGLEYSYRSGLSALNPGCASRLGTAILYAKGTVVRAHNRKGYSEDEGWLEARGIQSFSTKIDGQWVRVFNTHLSAPGYEDLRRLQARELSVATRPYRRALVLGDFNTRPWITSVMTPIWRAGFSDVDPYCRSTRDARCNRTLPETRDAKFDYILHRGINSRQCLLYTPTRDHRIVISDVTLAEGPRPVCSVT